MEDINFRCQYIKGVIVPERLCHFKMKNTQKLGVFPTDKSNLIKVSCYMASSA